MSLERGKVFLEQRNLRILSSHFITNLNDTQLFVGGLMSYSRYLWCVCLRIVVSNILSYYYSLRSVFRLWYDFHIKTMFGSFLPPVVCRRAHSCLIVFFCVCLLRSFCQLVMSYSLICMTINKYICTMYLVGNKTIK